MLDSKSSVNFDDALANFSPEEIEDLFGVGYLLYSQDDGTLGTLFQNEPHFGREDQSPNFTNSIHSYWKRARQCVSECIESGAKPSWYAVVRIDDILTAQEHNRNWTKVARRLRERKLVCLWVRECTKENKLHYNFLISNKQDKTDIEDTLRYAFEGMSFIVWSRPCGEVFQDRKCLFNYVFKAKVGCKVRDGSNKGEYVSDIYASKRVLFKKNSPLRKHSCIGQFYGGDRKAVKERLKGKAKEYADRRNEEQFIIEQATRAEQEQAEILYGYGQFVGWKTADQILLSLVETRIGGSGNAKP